MAEEVRDIQAEETASREEVNKLIQVKREKLAQLQAEGKDPFKITKYDVTQDRKSVV